MKRISILTLLIFWLTTGLLAQADSLRLSEKSRTFFKTQLDSMERMWAVQQSSQKSFTDNSPLLSKADVKKYLQESQGDIPLDYSNVMMDFVEFYSITHHNKTEKLLGLAQGLLPLADSILRAKAIPAELKYLVLVKSALNPHFMSEKGASGPWQFMYSSGSLYEMTIDSYIDERRDFIISTAAAAEMLKDLYKIYENWQLVITAYNCGPSNLNRAIRRAGSHQDYNLIYRRLPSPERDVYPAFVAMLYISGNKEKLGLEPVEINWPLKTAKVKVNKKLHLGQLAEFFDKDLRLLRDLNPVYRRHLIPASYKTFTLTLPVELKDTFLAGKDSIYHFRDTFYFDIKPEPEISSGKTYASFKPNKPSGNHTAIYYTIKPGDNMGYISEWFNVRINDLRYWNNIHGNMIRAGQRLLIYVPKDKADYYRKLDDMSLAEKQGHRNVINPVREKKQAVETLKEGEYTIYVVKKGDNPWSIAQKYPGVSDQDIMRWNNINPGDLRPGQKLKIKKK